MSASDGHVIKAEPEQTAYDVCGKCGTAVTLAFDGSGRLVTTLTNNAECYGR